jgi:hypothetical protein
MGAPVWTGQATTTVSASLDTAAAAVSKYHKHVHASDWKNHNTVCVCLVCVEVVMTLLCVCSVGGDSLHSSVMRIHSVTTVESVWMGSGVPTAPASLDTLGTGEITNLSFHTFHIFVD